MKYVTVIMASFSLGGFFFGCQYDNMDFYWEGMLTIQVYDAVKGSYVPNIALSLVIPENLVGHTDHNGVFKNDVRVFWGEKLRPHDNPKGPLLHLKKTNYCNTSVRLPVAEISPSKSIAAIIVLELSILNGDTTPSVRISDMKLGKDLDSIQNFKKQSRIQGTPNLNKHE